MPTLTAEYLDDLGRVRLEATDLDPGVVYSIDRSTDGGTTWTTVRGATNLTDGGVTVVYDYEYAPNIENLYRLVAPVISDTFERSSGPNGLHITGSGQYATTPHHAGLSVTGDIDIRWEGRLDDWTPGVNVALVSKWGGAGSRGYLMHARNNGALGFVWSTDGTDSNTETSSELIPVVGGEWIGLRITRDAGTGDVTFYTGPGVLGPFEQLGIVRTSTPSGLFDSTQPLQTLGHTEGTADSTTGVVGRLILQDGIGGTAVAAPDFANEPTGTTSFNDPLGNTWTVAGGAAIVGNDTAWGSADTGQNWNLYDNSGTALWSVSDGAGRVDPIDPGPFNVGRYIDGGFTDVEVQYDLIITPDFSQIRLAIRGETSSFAGYEVIFTAGSGNVARLAEFTGDGPATSVEVGTWATGQRWRVKARVVGTVLEARAWNTVNPEPSTWQIVTTSTSWPSGTIGLNFNVGGEALVDNFLVHGVPPLAVATATVTPSQDDVWLKSIAFPSLNQSLGCIFTSARARSSRVGIFDVKARHPRVGIADVGSTETFTAFFNTFSQEQNVAVTALLTFGSPLLLQSPPDDDPTGCGNIAAYPSGWFAPGDSTQLRPLRGKRVWEWQVPLIRVAEPDPQSVLPAHITWSVVWQMVDTWVELWDEWATWADLWGASVGPSMMAAAMTGGEV